MSTNIDARGLPCPQPVIVTKKALEGIAQGMVTIILDNVIAKENVLKFAVSQGCGVSVTQQAGDFLLKITKGEAIAKQAEDEVTAVGEVVYLITQDTLGHGNRELGAVLMKSFAYTLAETKPVAKSLLFINAAVLLTIAASPIREQLSNLEQCGVQILSCGTCLDYYNVKDQLAVGGITNMYTIIDIMATAGKVITI